MISKPIDYKYNEGQLIADLQKYIDATYGEHYSQNQYQATEFIIDGGHGEGFCIGNILKYAQRYGKKDGYNRKDLMKFPDFGRGDLVFPKRKALKHRYFQGKSSMLNQVLKRDVLLHFPYHNFGQVVDALREAAIDPLDLRRR